MPPRRQRKQKKIGELEEAIICYKKAEEERKKLDVDKIRQLEKEFKSVIEKSKREHQIFEQKKSVVKPSRTRSGLRRGHVPKADYTNGKWILKGMDDALEKYDDDELVFLKKSVEKIKVVSDLKFEHLKYLVGYVFLDELKSIKQGELKSHFHDRYEELKGRSKTELLSEVRTSLFTNEQRDYLNGLLQGLFESNTMDKNGDIKHLEINYVGIVMLAESTARIVKFVHGFDTFEQTFAYMKKRSREAHGISDDEND